MRQALNDNPVVQAIVIGVLLIGAALLLLTTMGGSNDAASPTAATSDSAVAPATAGAPATAQPASTAPAATTAPATTAIAPLVPGPGLPRAVMVDYARGKTVVLYVYEKKGIEDRDVLKAVNGLKGDRNLSVFVTDAKGISRYSRITQGVGVSQVPALVVVSPRGVSGDAPKATVSYGFRSPEGVTQAVRDAVYKGRTLGYDPG